MKTVKMYDENAYLKSFEARVISCEKAGDNYNIELEATAFFPEAGGQSGDTGIIGNSAVLDTNCSGDTIYHICSEPLEVGKNYIAELDFEKRFDKMQQHTGEHIISGLAHTLYGIQNVGFHLSDTYVTLDLNAAITDGQLNTLELEANKAIWTNSSVKAFYPDGKVLKSIPYRNRFEINENVRIVEIEGVDICACCAPHVKSTGEIGAIKMLRTEKIKLGTRIYIACGQRALTDYRQKHNTVAALSALLCSRQEELLRTSEHLLKEKANLNYQLSGFKRQALSEKISNMPEQKHICLILDENDTDILRFAANLAKEKSNVAGVFSKNENGYNYICASKTLDMSVFAKRLNSELNGRGGGRGEMIMGSVLAEKEKIEEFFQSIIDKI